MNRAAIFIDKDGTLVEDVPYNVEPRRIVLMPGAAEALVCLADAGYQLIVISNQPGVAFGWYPASALEAVNCRINELICDPRGHVQAFYYCCHHPEASEGFGRSCDCRKPAPGLIQQAAKDHAIDLRRSWMVGDILHDVEAGNRAGCRSLLLDVGHETQWLAGAFRQPTVTAAGWKEASEAIIHAPRRVSSPGPSWSYPGT